MSCVEKRDHSCGSGDGLQVFEDEGVYSGFCFACSTYVANPYGDKPQGYKPPAAVPLRPVAEILEEVNTIAATWPTVSLPTRGLASEALEYFGVKVGMSEEDGVTPDIIAEPIHRDGELVSYKMRTIKEKRIFSLGNSKKPDLFGWQQALASGAPRLIITEGAMDAVAVYQVLKELSDVKYKDFNPAVVSLTNGSGGAKAEVLRNLDEIKRNFKDVVLAFDHDDAGDKAAEEVVKIFPEAMRAKLPCKDANECLLKGNLKALKNAVLFKAAVAKNTSLVYGSSLKEAAMEKPAWGLSYPWPAMTSLTRGERWGETQYLGAGVKMGKSEILNALAAHKITVHGEKVFMCKPEEQNAMTYKLLVGKVAGKIFHDPNRDFDEEAFIEAEKMIGDSVAMLNLYQHVSWDNIKQDILTAAGEGYRTVYLDPITCFTNTVSSAEANELLVRIASEAAAMAHDHKLSMWLFCHLNAPGKDKKPHESGGKVLSSQFAGSRAMMRACHTMWGLQGDKSPDLTPEERNLRQLVLLEDRNYGQTGKLDLYWDSQTGLFEEV